VPNEAIIRCPRLKYTETDAYDSKLKELLSRNLKENNQRKKTTKRRTREGRSDFALCRDNSAIDIPCAHTNHQCKTPAWQSLKHPGKMNSAQWIWQDQ